MAGPLKGGGDKGPAIKEKNTFFEFFKILLSPRWEGDKALIARPLREKLFLCSFPLSLTRNNVR